MLGWSGMLDSAIELSKRVLVLEAGGQKKNGIWDEAAGSWLQRVASDSEPKPNPVLKGGAELERVVPGEG